MFTRKNSFILLSYLNPSFLEKMRELVQELQSEIAWFSATPLEPHVTVGQSTSALGFYQKLSYDEIKKTREKVSCDIKNILNEKLQKSILLLPADLFIAKSGWIIVEVREILLENKELDSATSLKDFHNQFVNVMETKEYQQTFKNPTFIRDGYKAHVSIGKIKLGHSIDDAIKKLAENNGAQKKALLEKCLATLPLLNLYQFELINNQKPLLQKRAPRRDFHISEIDVEQHEKKVYLHFRQDQNLALCIHFLFTLGIYHEGKPLTPHASEKNVLELTYEEYRAIEGKIYKCLTLNTILNKLNDDHTKSHHASLIFTKKNKQHPTESTHSSPSESLSKKQCLGL